MTARIFVRESIRMVEVSLQERRNFVVMLDNVDRLTLKKNEGLVFQRENIRNVYSWMNRIDFFEFVVYDIDREQQQLDRE